MSRDVRSDYVVWLNGRFCLAFLLAARKVAGDDLISALLLGCVVGANLDHLDQRPEDTRRFGALGSPGDDQRRPANSLSVSEALSIPRETSRVRINALVDAGLLRRVDRGVILPREAIQSPAVTEMSLVCLKALEDFVAGLRLIEACGIDGRHHLAQPICPMAGAAIRLGASHVVRSITSARLLTQDLGLTDAFILLAVAHLTSGYSGRADGFSGDESFPASLPAATGPARGSAVASFLNMPDATVRRHLDALVDHDHLTRSALGYDLALNGKLPCRWDEFHFRTTAATAHFMWRLRQCGIVTPQVDEPTG